MRIANQPSLKLYKEISTAFEVLSDSTERAAYDRTQRATAQPAEFADTSNTFEHSASTSNASIVDEISEWTSYCLRTSPAHSAGYIKKLLNKLTLYLEQSKYYYSKTLIEGN